MKPIIEYLKQLDFSETEAKIYLTLLQSGPLSVAELAKSTSINRTAVYPYISSLLEKGLLAEFIQRNRKKITTTELERLRYLVEKKLASAKSIESKLPQVMQLLETSFVKQKQETKVHVKYYKGENGVQEIYQEALKAIELRSYFNSELIRQVFPSNINVFAEAINKNKKIHVLEMLQDTHISREQRQEFLEKVKHTKRYFAKFLPKGVTLSALDILIYDGKVATINVEDTDDINGIVMENKAYYTNSRELFDLMWKMLPET